MTATFSRRDFLLSSSTAALLATISPAFGQSSWPNRPMRLVVPFAPGGSSDIVARAVAAELSKTIGTTVIVESKPGGAGIIAMQDVANSTDDHSFILGHTGTLAVNPYIFPRLPYDTFRDFVPVTLLTKVPSLYVVHPDLPARNLKEFVALCKAKPGQMNYGSAGNGSAGHLAFEYLKMVSNTFVVHVPYRGTGPMLTDLMAGRLQAAAIGAAAILQFVKSGKLRCIATGTTQRLAQLPEVMTVAEQGYPGFDMTQWYGLLAPAKWSADHVSKLETESIKALKTKNVSDRLAQETAIPVGSTSAEFAAFIRQEQARWKPVIARAGIKPDGG